MWKKWYQNTTMLLLVLKMITALMAILKIKNKKIIGVVIANG